MATPKTALRVGTEFVWDGETARVIALTPSAVQLATRAGMALLAIPEAIAALAETDSPTEAPGTATTALDFPISGLPQAALEDARMWLRHLNEVSCGFPHGLDTTDVGRPAHASYDPETTRLRDRVATKAKELGVGERTLWRKLSKLDQGLLGMLDNRTIRRLGIVADPAVADTKQKVRSALSAVMDTFTTKSNPTKKHLRVLTRRHLDDEWGAGVVAVPPERTFNRLVDEVGTGRSILGPAKRRRSIANRPPFNYGALVASRPGEFVLFDSTPLNVHGLDEVTGSWVNAELTIALDLYTRAIVAFRLTHTSTKAVDAALMLHDVLVPREASKELPPEGRWNYVGVPENIVLDRFGLEHTGSLAGLPVVEPETAVIDRGRVFVSDAFLGAATALGVNVILARPRTPTDKPQVERYFRTLREGLLVGLPGYKGGSVWDRGEYIERDAIYTIDELEAIIGDWIATVYHRSPHDGLHIWSKPHVDVSPNDMYEAGLARAGFYDVVRDEYILLSLLPTVWGTIQHYGFDHKGIRYDSAALNDYRKPHCPKSPYGGHHAGKWPMRYDPRDVSKVWFQDPYNHSWHQIPWHGAEEMGERVFDESLVAYAKTLMLRRGGRGSPELTETIFDILDRVSSGNATRKDLREVAKSEFRSRVAARDHSKVATATPARDDIDAALRLVPDLDETPLSVVAFTRLDFGAECRDPSNDELDDDEFDDDEVDDDEFDDDDEETIDEW